jgi:hypothetical protein
MGKKNKTFPECSGLFRQVGIKVYMRRGEAVPWERHHLGKEFNALG